MNLNEILSTIDEVNSFVTRNQWMDFSVWKSHRSDLEVSGTLDESYWSDLRVKFLNVCWASIRYQGWKSDTSRAVLSLVEGGEAYRLNALYQIEVGHHLFKFVAEDFTAPMYVAAQGIEADYNRIEFET